MDTYSLAHTVQKIVIMALPLVFAIVLHEVAHGWVADKLGDPTARYAGRLTLNPISHIDPFGTIIMPLLLILLTPYVFAYAKPVPINPYNFQNPKKGMAMSSLAGPATNMLMAFGCAILLRVFLPLFQGILPEAIWSVVAKPIALILAFGVAINVVLAVLNMLPIPPLDGSRIVYWLLPEKQGAAYYRLERYGMLILFGLLFLGILGKIIMPVIVPLLYLLLGNDLLSLLIRFLQGG